MMKLSRCIYLCFILTAISSELPAQHDIPYHPEILGEFERPIITSVTEAQNYFNQGMRLRYAFASRDAANSFREAQRLDPDCAMCYWGEAWALGPYLNNPGGNPAQAEESIQKALRLAEEHTSPVEQALIEALSHRYSEQSTNGEAYARAMASVYDLYPDDPEVATLYGESLLLLEPRRGSRDLNNPAVQRIHQAFERVLEKDLRHPGACHLYVHATESTEQPEKAEACAEYLADSVPGVSHMNHMPAHTWSQTGRWGDAVRVSLQSVETDRRAADGHGFALYPSHNLHMLAIVASYDGQSEVAIQAGKDYAEMMNNNMYHALTLIRFGRFDEISGIGERPAGDVGAGIWDFSQGYANLRQGEPDSAQHSLNQILNSAASTSHSFRVHSGEQLLGILAGILEGEILRAEGDTEAAIAAFNRAASIEDDLMWDEPEPLPFASRHWLGALLLEEGQYEEAERVYNEELSRHPKNGWSLLGLKQSLQAQGKPFESARNTFEENWRRSDAEIQSSRF